jgi:hypothetical protein
VFLLTAHPVSDDDVAISELVDSTKINVLVALFSDGRVACFVPTSNSNSNSNFSLSSLLGVWIADIQDGCCVAINGAYRLVAVGRSSGVVDVFALDESTGAWFLSHTLSLPADQFPGGQDSLGAVSIISWSHTDEMAIAVSWDEGGLAIWSVFGSLISFSFGPNPNITPTPRKTAGTKLRSLCWSKDGYGLWMAPCTTGEEDPVVRKGCTLYVLNFLKNAIVNNPTVSNHHHIMLQAGDRLHLLVSNTLVANGNRGRMQEIGSAIASTPHWKILQVPESYLVLNWPLKYSCVDCTGSYIATAGKAGLALYSCVTRKWKLFSNEQQEQGVVCCGGVVWWKDIVVFPCVASKSVVEVRFYSLHSKLDTSHYLYTLKMMSPLAKINLHGNHLLVLTNNGTLIIYHMSQEVEPQTSAATLKISKYYESSLSQSVPRVELAISAMTSTLKAEPSRTLNQESGCGPDEDLESILLNMSGKILMVQRTSTVTTETGRRKVTFGQPVCLASQVETVWAPPPERAGQHCNHMSQSLWLHCGSSGLKVWLPLFPDDNPHPTFLSKRIMLSIETTVYPQVVLFLESAILGLSHETLVLSDLSSPGPSLVIFPYATVERAIQLCLHPILRQLLKRNLGAHALQLAQGCCHLPYFTHVLECMLHEVLEEEAPANLPLPDPLLPQVVQFIKHFPQFHTTVSSCARKTEVALWRYLFAAVGKPRDLFEVCIKSGNLATAATYLIIIQNLETSAVSKKLATRLLESALEAGVWGLANNLVRYLQAIGGGEVSLATPKTTTPGTPFSASGPLSSESVGVVKTPEEMGTEEPKSFARPQFVADTNTKVEYFIDLLLTRHARKLLAACQIKDLGKFAANLDFGLMSWLASERTRAGKVEDFVSNLLTLHQQFDWPLPFTPHFPHHLQRTPCDGAPDNSNTTENGNRSGNLSQGTEDVDKGHTPTDSPGSSSLNRSLRPPDLDLKEVSTIQTPPTPQVMSAVAEVKLQAVDKPPTVGSPWQPHYSSSSSSDLDQMGNLPSSSTLKDATWLLQLPSKPPEKSEIELRYLSRLMMSSMCLEWSLLLAVLLQDGSLLQSIASMLGEIMRSDSTTGIAVAKQLAYHISCFQKWADNDCPGYKKLDADLGMLSLSVKDLLDTPPAPPKQEVGNGETIDPPTEQGPSLPTQEEPSPASTEHSPTQQTPNTAESTCVVS